LTSVTPFVRAASLEDVPGVVGLLAVAASDYASATPKSDLERLVTMMPGTLLVAELHGAIVGVLIAAWDGWRGNMYRLAVRDESRRQGVATKLVEAGEQRLRQLGATRVTALVADSDVVAAAFWDAAGYPIDANIRRRVRSL
jgi:ribosomal protein S18 acetylase RimI-like enzyme